MPLARFEEKKMSFVDGFFLLAAMMIGVYIPRLLPMGLLAKRTIGKNFQTWLSYIPVAILSALLAPEIFMRNGEFFFAKENLFLIAFGPALLAAYFTKSLFATLLTGMVLVAAMRYFNIFA